MKQEIEILVELREPAQQALKKLGNLEKTGTKHTIDTYYFDPLRDDLQPSSSGRLLACCRVRKQRDAWFITYKNDHFKGDEWLYSDEFETQVHDGTVIQEIIKKLGLKELVTVDSKKTIMTSTNYEVVVEEVKNLGTFIEIEYKPTEDVGDIEAAKQQIRNWLDTLGIETGDELNAGKPELLLRKSPLKE